jgi:hypothetical protein
MKRNQRIFMMALLILSLTSILHSCGGGGGGSSSTSGTPFIAAELDSFPTGSVPPGLAPSGFNSMASVYVMDDNSGDPITNAIVSMNGVTLTYNAANQDYEGNLVVATGRNVALSVIVGGNNYTTSISQFTSYPTISAPVSGVSWTSSNVNTVSWAGGASTTNAVYTIGVLDAADPSGNLIWPLDNFVKSVPISSTSYAIPAFNITAGNRLLIVGISTDAPIPIPNAAPGSGLWVGGYNYVPITVTGMPVTLRTSGTTASFNGVTWSGTQFVAIGSDGTILASPDGITWTSRTSGMLTVVLYGITWSGTQFVAVDGAYGAIFTSPDGVTWTARVSGTTNPLFSIVWSGTKFVAVGWDGTILTSPDGINWTSRISGTLDILQGVAWSGTQFVAVGRGGASLTSPDGVTWTVHASGANLNSVIWSGTQFVAVGWGGAILTSPDGINWTSHFSGTSDTLLGVAWSGTQFVAVGGSGNTGTIFTSSDGITWTQQASGTSNALSGAVWSGTQFVAVGWGGTILTFPGP